MLDSSELLDVARQLAAAGTAPAPNGAQLRRAVSTAYYALFHAVTRAGALSFMGAESEDRPGHALLYRGFSHGRMKAVCQSIDRPQLTQALRRQLGRSAVSQDMREFASAFVALQEGRHLADYDPQATISHTDAVDPVDGADRGLQAFNRVPADEKADILALMLVNARD